MTAGSHQPGMDAGHELAAFRFIEVWRKPILVALEFLFRVLAEEVLRRGCRSEHFLDATNLHITNREFVHLYIPAAFDHAMDSHRATHVGLISIIGPGNMSAVAGTTQSAGDWSGSGKYS